MTVFKSADPGQNKREKSRQKASAFFTSIFVPVQNRRQSIFLDLCGRLELASCNWSPDVCVLSRTSVNDPVSNFAATLIGINRGKNVVSRKPIKIQFPKYPMGFDK